MELRIVAAVVVVVLMMMPDILLVLVAVHAEVLHSCLLAHPSPCYRLMRGMALISVRKMNHRLGDAGWQNDTARTGREQRATTQYGDGT